MAEEEAVDAWLLVPMRRGSSEGEGWSRTRPSGSERPRKKGLKVKVCTGLSVSIYFSSQIGVFYLV